MDTNRFGVWGIVAIDLIAGKCNKVRFLLVQNVFHKVQRGRISLASLFMGVRDYVPTFGYSGGEMCVSVSVKQYEGVPAICNTLYDFLVEILSSGNSRGGNNPMR